MTLALNRINAEHHQIIREYQQSVISMMVTGAMYETIERSIEETREGIVEDIMKQQEEVISIIEQHQKVTIEELKESLMVDSDDDIIKTPHE